MAQRSWLAAVAFLALVASPAALADEEEDDDGLAPWVGELYQDVEELVGADPGDGLASLLLAVLDDNSPDPDSAYDLVRTTSDGVDHELARVEDAREQIPGPQAVLEFVAASQAAGLRTVEDGVVVAEGAMLLVPVEDLVAAHDAAQGQLAPLTSQGKALAEDLLVPVVGYLFESDPDGGPYVASVPVPVVPSSQDGFRPTDVAPALLSGTPEGLVNEALPEGPASAAPATGPLAKPGMVAQAVALPSLLGLPEEAAFAAAVAALGLLLLIPPMYHRLQRSTLLDHATRGKLFTLVEARPGIHIEELARASGCSRSTAVYHLHLLARHGHVVAMRSRKTVHYYPNNGSQEPADRERRALLTSPRTRTVAAVVAAQPGITRTELAAAAGVAVSTLSWHVGRLIKTALVEERLAAGGRRGLYPVPALHEMLRPWATMPPADGEAEPTTVEAVLPAEPPAVQAPAVPAAQAGVPSA